MALRDNFKFIVYQVLWKTLDSIVWWTDHTYYYYYFFFKFCFSWISASRRDPKFHIFQWLIFFWSNAIDGSLIVQGRGLLKSREISQVDVFTSSCCWLEILVFVLSFFPQVLNSWTADKILHTSSCYQLRVLHLAITWLNSCCCFIPSAHSHLHIHP